MVLAGPWRGPAARSDVGWIRPANPHRATPTRDAGLVPPASQRRARAACSSHSCTEGRRACSGALRLFWGLCLGFGLSVRTFGAAGPVSTGDPATRSSGDPLVWLLVLRSAW